MLWVWVRVLWIKLRQSDFSRLCLFSQVFTDYLHTLHWLINSVSILCCELWVRVLWINCDNQISHVCVYFRRFLQIIFNNFVQLTTIRSNDACLFDRFPLLLSFAAVVVAECNESIVEAGATTTTTLLLVATHNNLCCHCCTVATLQTKRAPSIGKFHHW